MPRRRHYDPERQPMRRIWAFTKEDGIVAIVEAYLSDWQLGQRIRRIRRSHRGQTVGFEIHTADKNGELPYE